MTAIASRIRSIAVSPAQSSMLSVTSAATLLCARPSLRTRQNLFRLRSSPQTPTFSAALKRRQSQDASPPVDTTLEPRRRSTRPSAAKNSLRRVVVEAQRSKDGDVRKPPASEQQEWKRVTAICAAQEYDIAHIAHTLKYLGYTIDPCGTTLYPQVVHVKVSARENKRDTARADDGAIGDLFVFPSGTLVAWDVPRERLLSLVKHTFRPAALSTLGKVEEEDLEYAEDPAREHSSIRGDRIMLGTKLSPEQNIKSQGQERQGLDAVLAKIAFSSGLSRSTKLAVLESLLSDYFESTKSIPDVLSRGGPMPFTRSFMLQKTGQLLSIRAQLNLYSELTDSLPDLFWDSKHELGLEGYYDQVGKALDTNVRIKVLNEKMDYAQEIASVLRQQLSERHGVRLEWIIIILIAVEVVFAIEKEVKEYRHEAKKLNR